MKTIKSMLFGMIFFSFGLMAQTFPPKAATMHGRNITVGTYTFSNSTADTLYINSTVGYQSVTLQPVITGSVVGNAALYGSLDNANFVPIGTSTLSLAGGNPDTKAWVIEYSPYSYYRIITAGGSTVTATNGVASGFFLGSKPSGLEDVSRLMAYNSITTNTVINSATSYMTIKLTSWFNTVSFQVNCTKQTGTQGGTLTLQGSNDGLNFVTANTGYITNDVTTAPFTTGGSATFTATDIAVATKIWVVRGNPYQYYRVSWTGTGTMKSAFQVYILGH